MNSKINDQIASDFDTKSQMLVISELESINLTHVMAESECNLNNTRHAILRLSKGNLNTVIELTKAAKIDFRDVIMQAMQEDKNSK